MMIKIRLSRRLSALLMQDSGQDLIEYSLLVGLLALGVATGMQTAAAGVNSVFGAISAVLKPYTS